MRKPILKKYSKQFLAQSFNQSFLMNSREIQHYHQLATYPEVALKEVLLPIMSLSKTKASLRPL